jgi:hypothetical protein
MLGLSQRKQLFRVGKAFLQGDKLLIGKNGKLPHTVFNYYLGIGCHAGLSAICFFPMQHAVDYHSLAFDFKQHAIIANSQPIFWREGRELPYITSKTNL